MYNISREDFVVSWTYDATYICVGDVSVQHRTRQFFIFSEVILCVSNMLNDRHSTSYPIIKKGLNLYSIVISTNTFSLQI